MAAPVVACPVSLGEDAIRIDFPSAFTDEEFDMFCDAFAFLFMGAAEQDAFYREFIARPMTHCRHGAASFMHAAMGAASRPRCLVINLLEFASDGDPLRVMKLVGKLTPYVSKFRQVIQGTGIATRNEAIKKKVETVASKLGADTDAMFVTADVDDAERRARAFVTKFMEAESARKASGRISLRR